MPTEKERLNAGPFYSDKQLHSVDLIEESITSLQMQEARYIQRHKCIH